MHLEATRRQDAFGVPKATEGGRGSKDLSVSTTGYTTH